MLHQNHGESSLAWRTRRQLDELQGTNMALAQWVILILGQSVTAAAAWQHLLTKILLLSWNCLSSRNECFDTLAATRYI